MIGGKNYEQWLENYLVLHMARDASRIPELFAEDGVYWYGPYYQPRNGVDAIYEHHQNALSHQEDIKCKWKILAVTDEFALAWFDLTLKDLMEDEPNAYQGIIKFTLDDEGKCTFFEEWYNCTNI
ncbi:MAG TPA: nuclear transport factor 2 family protein [Phycisphaerae bacterium]|nr:nuclear transport factor 2 family protein [Phycisphaerae bacterium]